MEVNYKTGIGFLLSTLGRKTEYIWNTFLQDHDITTSEFTALSLLSSRGQCMQKELAREANVDPRNIVSTIASLHNRGWVESLPSRQDRRAKIIQITALGQKTLRALYDDLGPQDEAFFGNLTQAEKDQLQHLLRKLKYGNSAK